jgi:hypothetical protein
MKKEILTLQDIQSELHGMLRKNIIGLIASVIGLSLFLILCCATIEDDMPLRMILMGAVLLIGFVILIARAATSVVQLGTILNRPGELVRDRMIGMETKGFWRQHPNIRRLHFASYGEYKIPGENYGWSEMYAMSDKTVYLHAECGDEFYLVLSKPHTGKILLAYNTKMFDYQPTPQES